MSMDDLSQAIGGIRSDVHAIREKQQEINGKLDLAVTSAIEHKVEIEKLTERVKTVESDNKDLLRSRDKMMGVVTVVSLIISVGAAIVAKLFK